MTDLQPDGYLATEMYNGVLVLRLGAFPAHPLSLSMVRALKAEFSTLTDNSDVRAVVLLGEGRIFCAGHDLKEIRRHRQDADDGQAYVTTLFHECTEMMLTLARLPQPTIAVVQGVATAGGLQLMCSCDMTFAGPGARFCLPGVNNGGFCTTPAVAVGRKIGRNHLMELALSGELFDAEWALSAGLINRIVPDHLLFDTAIEFAETLARCHAPALAAGKAMLYRQLELPLDQAYAEATDVMIGHFMDPHRVALERGD